MKRSVMFAGLIVLIAGALFFLFARRLDPPVETIVASALKSVHEQNRLSAFAARFVTVVTSRKSQFGLAAEKTLIIPATVRYEVDLAQLGEKNASISCDQLVVELPDPQIAGPEFDLGGIREYGSGAVLMAITDIEQTLDQSNRAKAKADIVAQAKAPTMMQLAREASRKAMLANLNAVIRASGSKITPQIRFPAEPQTKFCLL